MLGRGLLWLLGILALASWCVLGALIVRSSPEALIAQFFFYALLFVSMFFTSSLLMLYLTLKILPSERHEGEFRTSILCGFPPALAMAVAVWLQSLRALSVMSGSILVGVVLLVELATLVKGRKNRGATGIQEAGH